MFKKYKIVMSISLILQLGCIILAIYFFTIAKYAFGIVCLLFFLILLIIDFFMFFVITTEYPLNTYSDYKYNPRGSRIGFLSEGNYEINIFEKQKGVWEILFDDEHMIFDMRGYFFPKAYISSFFIRNYNYIVINKNGCNLRKLFRSLRLSPYKKYQNVKIIFHSKRKKKGIYLIKSAKTKPSLLMKLIIESKYYIEMLPYRTSPRKVSKFVKMNDEIYISESGHIKTASLLEVNNDDIDL